MKHFYQNKQNKQKGFTLIEILVVIGIIAILAAIVIVAINPAKQFAQARNTDRQSAVDNILNAIGQRMADNKGVFGGAIGTTGQVCPGINASTTNSLWIYSATSSVNILSGGFYNTNNSGTLTNTNLDLSCLTPIYISKFPSDPVTASDTPSGTSSTNHATGYTLSVDNIGRVTVCAPASFQEAALSNIITEPICVTR